LFKGGFPEKNRGQAMPDFYGHATVATSINSLWLRCVAAAAISDPAPSE
jgi:hypothetical protein